MEESKLPDDTVKSFNLDEQIGKLLRDKNLTEYEKSVEYAKLLQQFLTHQQKGGQSFKDLSSHQTTPEQNGVPPTNTEGSISIKAADSRLYPNEDILTTLPQKFKRKGEALLSLIEKQPDLLKWNDKGEIIYKGDIIKSSHIADLVKSAVVPKVRGGATGISIFSKALGDMNVPRGLLSKTFKDGEKEPAGSEMDNQTVEKNAFTPTRDIALPALKAGKKKKIKVRTSPYPATPRTKKPKSLWLTVGS